MRGTVKTIVSNLHYAGTALLAIMAVPAIQHLQLPMRVRWGPLMLFYWVGFGPRSVMYALVFCALGLPLGQTLGPFWTRYKQQKLRFVLVLLFVVALSYLLPFAVAVLLTVDALFVVELAERNKSETGLFRRKAISVVLAAAYMFLGVTLVVIYNDIVVASRFPVSYDAFLNRIDSSMLLGRSVSSIAHTMLTVAPRRFFSFLDFVYFQMFLIVGAALLISAYESCKRGLQFVGTCLSAYYLALLIFFLWPTYGPYVFCSTHGARYPPYLTSYVFQMAGMPALQALAEHRTRYLASGYYIAFPSMHIALPMIATWFLRRWRPVFWLLVGYNCILVVAIVFLEWHYVLDVAGGAAVALLALAVADRGH